jgi:hypothetical protein
MSVQVTSEVICIKYIFKKDGKWIVDKVHVVEGGGKLWDSVNKLMNFLVPYEAGN